METSKNSTRQLTLDELIYSQEGSPANPTLSPESERERRTSATCGQRCCALFENAPRATSWAKTFAALLVGMEGWSSRRCALTWKLVGTPYNRLYFQLQASALPTEEIASGLLLTPTATELCEHPDDMRARAEKNGYKNGTKYNSLTSQIVYGMLPTPTAFDYNTPRSQEAWDKAKEKHGEALQNPLKQMAAFGMLPTPIASEVHHAERVQKLKETGAETISSRKNGDNRPNGIMDYLDFNGMLPTPCAQEGGKISGKENQDSLTKRARQETGKTSQLSPLFVEEMMGFPQNWTASPFQSGDEKA